jgi:hypothetical protein
VSFGLDIARPNVEEELLKRINDFREMFFFGLAPL